MFKLHERRAQCLLSLRRFKEAKQSFEEALTAVSSAKLDRKKKEKFLKDIKTGLETIETAEAETNNDDNTEMTTDDIRDTILNVGRYYHIKFTVQYVSFFMNIHTVKV